MKKEEKKLLQLLIANLHVAGHVLLYTIIDRKICNSTLSIY